MSRRFSNWIEAYVKYASVTEAPKRMHFWSGISAVAGTLRRRVWLDLKRYQIYPNFYVVLVAPPGIIAKSTTLDVAMRILRKVPGVKFGPDVITWPALVQAFAAASESFEYLGDWIPMSPLTLEASELGSLLNPQDREMVSLYITLWDGRKKFDKVTKTSGSDSVEAPWINLIAATTPHWIADNMPVATIGGGLTSRVIFVYGDRKERYVAWVDEFVDDSDPQTELALYEDLVHISTTLLGPMTVNEEARAWERKRYETFWKINAAEMNNDTLEGYAARKQTHILKTAMVLSAAQRDTRVIQIEDLQLAAAMLDDLEPDMQKVFSNIGRTDDSMQAERFIDYVRKKGTVSYEEAYRMIHIYFPDFRDFEGILTGAVRSGQIRVIQVVGGNFLLKAVTAGPPGDEAAAA